MATNTAQDPQQFLENWLIRWMAKEFALAPADVDLARAFLAYGMNSIQAMSMVGELEIEFGLRLPPTLAWDYPTAAELIEHLVPRLSEAGVLRRSGTADQGPAQQVEKSFEEATISAEDAEALLAKLDDFSEAELDALLAKHVQRQS